MTLRNYEGLGQARRKAEISVMQIKNDQQRIANESAGLSLERQRNALEESKHNFAKEKDQRQKGLEEAELGQLQAETKQTELENKEAAAEHELRGMRTMLSLWEDPQFQTTLAAEPSPDLDSMLSTSADVMDTHAALYWEDGPWRRRPGETPRDYLMRAKNAGNDLRRIEKAGRDARGDDGKPPPGLQQHEKLELHDTMMAMLGFNVEGVTFDDEGKPTSNYNVKAGDLFGDHRITESDMKVLNAIELGEGTKVQDRQRLQGSALTRALATAVQRKRREQNVDFHEAISLVQRDFAKVRYEDDLKRAQDFTKNKAQTRRRKLLMGPGGPQANSGISPQLSPSERKKLKQTLDGDSLQLNAL